VKADDSETVPVIDVVVVAGTYKANFYSGNCQNCEKFRVLVGTQWRRDRWKSVEAVSVVMGHGERSRSELACAHLSPWVVVHSWLLEICEYLERDR